MAQKTELSNSALPGAVHTFSAKSGAGPHSGLFTALCVMATPGGRHTFQPKTPDVPPVTTTGTLGGVRPQFNYLPKKNNKDDEWIMVFG